MAEAALTSVLIKLGELAVSEAKILLQVGDDIILLGDRLQWLQAIIRDEDRERRRAGTNGLTHVWVSQTRDVAFEVEDAIDDFFYEEEVVGRENKSYHRGRKLRRCFTCFSGDIVVRHGLVGRISIIQNRLDQIAKNRREYKIQHSPSVPLAIPTTSTAAWRDDLDYAAVFDMDVRILQKMLLHQEIQHESQKKEKEIQPESSQKEEETQHRMFISIVGDSGAGKSTLSKIILSEMTSKMQVLVWYHMEPGSSTADLLAEVYHRAFLQCIADEQQEDEVIICTDIGDKLRILLARKRYLLILSGISSVNILNTLRASLPDPDPDPYNDNGGRVMLILDTKNEEIALHANTMNIYGINGVHLLTRLDEGRSAQLFLWKVSRKGQERRNLSGHEGEISTMVHNITGGLPMAIVLLAGLLRHKNPAQWVALLHEFSQGNIIESRSQEAHKMRQDPAPSRQPEPLGRDMELIFWASFEDLPNDLKPCFLYLASCHKNISHPANKIVRIWIAEGFIKPQRDGKTLEEVGHDYLKELVSRCLVEVEEMKAGGGIQLFRVHDSIMRFLQTEARVSGFMEILDIHSDNVTVPPLARRLSVQSGDGRRFASTFANKKFPKLRSFICHIVVKHQHHEHDLEFLHRSKFLRVISIQGLRLANLPVKIGDMINLRYVCIDCSSLCRLPSSIARLLNLQTLDISNTQVEEIDKTFWKIKTLRHVLAKNLSLPETMPDNCGCSELRTLHGVKPAAQGVWNAERCTLLWMTNLRSLEMHGFEYTRHGTPAFEAALGNMHLLGHLKLQGDEIPSCVFTDPSLRSLQTMVLQGNVNWNNIPVDRLLRRVRPNLVQLQLNYHANQGMPDSIRNQLRAILIQEN